MKITKERVKELRSWTYGMLQSTDEYKTYLREYIYSNSLLVNQEVEYILKKSVDDSEAPFSYEDIGTYLDEEACIYAILEELPEDEEDLKEFMEEINEFRNSGNGEADLSTKEELEKYLNTLDKDELITLLEEHSYLSHLEAYDYEKNFEIFQWFVMDERILNQLEERGECVLNGKFWGRCTFGQAIELDYVIIRIFKEWYLDLYGVGN